MRRQKARAAKNQDEAYDIIIQAGRAAQITEEVKHLAGNRQILLGTQRWHLPKDASLSQIPMVDALGDQLQAAVDRTSQLWSRTKLTATEARAIQQAFAEGKPWLAGILQQQAKGRWVEARVKSQFPNLRWSGVGVDATDPITGIHYEILSGTKSNLDIHARRMPDVLFRFINFQ